MYVHTYVLQSVLCAIFHQKMSTFNCYMFVLCALYFVCKQYVCLFLVQKCLREILSNADVVLSTLTGASNEGVMKYGTVTCICSYCLMLCDPLRNIFTIGVCLMTILTWWSLMNVLRYSLTVCLFSCTVAFIVNYAIHRLLKLAVGFPY